MAGKTLWLWGAGELAAYLAEELIFNDRAVQRLATYLPEFKRIHEEEAASRRVPAPDRQRLIRADVDTEIARRLKHQACVTISGIAGLGKSSAASAFATQHEDDYDLAIWLDRGEVRRNRRIYRGSRWCAAASFGTWLRFCGREPVCW
jgi:hypothetical protein